MKLLFLVLLAINLLVFGWEYQRRHKSPPQDVQLQLPLGVKRLQLVGEQVASESAVVAGADEDRGDATDAEGERLVGDVDAVEPLTMPGMQNADAVPTPVAAADPEAEPAETAEQAIVSKLESVPEPKSELLGPDMGVGERGSGSQTELVAVSEKPPEPTEQASPPGRCFTLGAFKKLSEVETVAERLESLIDEVDWREETREKQIGYWVLIPAQASRQAARDKVKELLDAGIEDVWRFTKGDLANAISIGLFSNRAPAERHRRAIAKKGFNTEVRPRLVDESFYWLDFRTANDRELPSELQEELARDYSGVKVSARECPPETDR